MYRPRDLPHIMRVERASFGKDAWPIDVFEEYAIGFAQLFLVAISGARTVGYSIAAVSRGSGELASIAVLPRYRGRGIATSLLKATVRKLRRRGVRSIWLMVRTDNPDAIALYKRFGFARTATVRHYYEDGASGWRMKLVKGDV
jgi:ribosomal-protein-alanine acetyltransferase